MSCPNVVRRHRLPAVVCAVLFSAVGFSASAQAANLAPNISGTPASYVYVGSAYSFTPTASDPERATLRFTIANKPAWAAFSASTGRLSGTPTAVGYWTNIQISVSDGVNTTALPAFALRAVSKSNVAPTISGTPPPTVVVGSTYSFVPTAKDANNDPLRFTISGKPAWASFSNLTGQLSGTPTAAGTFASIVISTTDGSKTVSLPAFTITVTNPVTNHAPTISGTPARSATVGTAYSFRPTASDPDGDTLGYSIQNRPSWATFSTATGQLSGTPTAAGSHANIVISASDGKASTALPAFTITVTDALTSSSPGAATLSWSVPTQATDGSTLTDLAGYRISYGMSPTELAWAVQVSNPGINTYVIDGLKPGTYYFAVRAYSASGTQSAISNVSTRTVR
jgi:Putative Ig domain